MGFPGGAVVNSACEYRRGKRNRFGSWGGKIPSTRKHNPFQYSCWDNSMVRDVGYSPWGHKESDMTACKLCYTTSIDPSW